jgi:hypothetical protein
LSPRIVIVAAIVIAVLVAWRFTRLAGAGKKTERFKPWYPDK